MVGRVDEIRVGVGRGSKSRHGSRGDALWGPRHNAVEDRRDSERGSKARHPGTENQDSRRCHLLAIGQHALGCTGDGLEKYGRRRSLVAATLGRIAAQRDSTMGASWRWQTADGRRRAVE
jgi:hypothetical protein